MGNLKLIGMRPITSHQKPTGKPRLYEMEASASSCLCQLAQRYIEVTIHTSLQRRTVLQFMGERRCRHAPGSTRALHQGVQRCRVYAQHERSPEHAFVADETDFEPGVAVDRGDQRDVAVSREEYVTDALTGLAEHIAKTKLDLFATCQQMLTILAWQGGEQTILRDGRRRL